LKRKSASDLTGDDDATSEANSVFTDPPRTPVSGRSGVSGFLAGKSSKPSGGASDDGGDLPPPPPTPPAEE